MQINTRYRKDTKHPPGHGYGRKVGGIWVATRPGAVKSAIIHATHGRTGSANAAEAAFLCNSPDVSAGYLIGDDGELFQILRDEDQAWHSGDCTPNLFENPTSIGIELKAAKTEQIAPAQKNTLAWLLREINARHGVPSSLMRSHRSVAVPAGRKSDPGTWPDEELNAWIAALFVSRYTPDSPIIAPAGPPITSFPNPPRGGYDSVSILTILRAYARICAPVGVDPVLAIAQMCHETGALTSFWSQRPRRNPAGIGVNGQTREGAQPYPHSHWAWDGSVWRFGVSFAQWEPDAITAHVGRLLAYALKEGEESPEQKALIDYALDVRALPASYRGIAPTLQGLEGTWAVPGDHYADAIAAWANRLIE